jgi:nucleotide-binding universal stress UspA family protein
LRWIKARAARGVQHRSIQRQKAKESEVEMKILLAVDGSDYTKRMLGWVAAHDEFVGSGHEYTVLTIVPELPRRVGLFRASDADIYYEDQGERVLHPVRQFAAQKGWKAEFARAVGNPADEIAALAERGRFELIVIGSHGHSALGNVVLGSVTMGVLARCKTPVLVIR